jgi:hypothetical protein
MAAIQAIRSISNWLYWQSPNNANGSTPDSQTSLIHVSRKSAEPNLDKLREAVAARKQARQSTSPTRKIPSNHLYEEEYWTPLILALPDSTQDNSNYSAAYNTKPSPTKEGKDAEDRDHYRVDDNKKKKKKKPMIWEVPAMAAVIASVIIRVQIGSEGAIGGVKEHIGGSLALEIVNSSWLPVILAGITWFIIGAAITQVMLIMIYIVEAIESRQQ